MCDMGVPVMVRDGLFLRYWCEPIEMGGPGWNDMNGSGLIWRLGRWVNFFTCLRGWVYELLIIPPVIVFFIEWIKNLKMFLFSSNRKQKLIFILFYFLLQFRNTQNWSCSMQTKKCPFMELKWYKCIKIPTNLFKKWNLYEFEGNV